MSTQHQRTWSCKCGQIKANLIGKPVLDFNCHCHSCVAGARYIADKTNNSGIPMINSTGGASPSAFAARQVKFCSELSDADGVSKLKFVQIGNNGKAWRSYTTCCGTQMTNCIMPGLLVLNRNGIKNADGSAYTPDVLNIQKKDAFNPESVPEPSHETAPISWMPKFMIPALNPFAKKLQNKELFPNDAEAEIVPITWE